ncbi:leucine-rich repeat domain-containing protein [Clostridiaceae bacterium M8S5]|nr:leucine-rich repeat domain-containing protein [Clostridiaceae bacterium M8S5]
MKKRIMFLLVLFLMVFSSTSVFAQSDWKIVKDGKTITLSENVVHTEGSSVYLSVKDVGKLLGFDIQIDNHVIIMKKNGVIMKFDYYENSLQNCRNKTYCCYFINGNYYANEFFFQDNLISNVIFSDEKKEILIDTKYSKLLSGFANLVYNDNFIEIKSNEIVDTFNINKEQLVYIEKNCKTSCDIKGSNTGMFKITQVKDISGELKLTEQGETLCNVDIKEFKQGMLGGLKYTKNKREKFYSPLHDKSNIDSEGYVVEYNRGFTIDEIDNFYNYLLEYARLGLVEIGSIDRDSTLNKYDYYISIKDMEIYHKIFNNKNVKLSELDKDEEQTAILLVSIDEKNRIDNMRFFGHFNENNLIDFIQNEYTFKYIKKPDNFSKEISNLKREIYKSYYPSINIDKIVNFKDKELEETIREKIDLKSGTIHVYDLLNVNVITLLNREITCLDGIENMCNLEFVVIDGCKLMDISKLANLDKLEYLYITNVRAADFSTLKNTKNIRELILNNCDIVDMSWVCDMKMLELLDLTKNKIRHIPNLSKQTNLKKLILNENQIVDLEPLKYITSNLEELELIKNNIEDITPVDNLEYLSYLNLSMNKISDLKVFENIDYVESLYLSHNNISDVTPLNYTKIKTLSLDYNNITSIDNLLIGDIELLSLSNNHIKTIHPKIFNKCDKLFYFDLANNQINDNGIGFLYKLKDLMKINMKGNLIEDEVLKQFHNVEYK